MIRFGSARPRTTSSGIRVKTKNCVKDAWLSKKASLAPPIPADVFTGVGEASTAITLGGAICVVLSRNYFR